MVKGRFDRVSKILKSLSHLYGLLYKSLFHGQEYLILPECGVQIANIANCKKCTNVRRTASNGIK